MLETRSMSSCVLALDTSTPRGGVAVVRGDEVVYARSFGSQRSHNSELFAPLGEALELCRDDLELIVVGTGPGSYTGVRIGIAAAQGLAFSRKVPVIGLSSLLAPDVVSVPLDYIVCGDARRGQFYIATLHNEALSGEMALLNAEEFFQARKADKERLWLSYDEKVPLSLEGVTLVKPSAVRLAKLGVKGVTSEVGHVLEPHYLSAPFITMPKSTPVN
jgi:tRNA threonylcarbamoyladenosine biosynthesis protein TsaB